MSELTRYQPHDEWLMEPFRDSFRDLFRRLAHSDWPALRGPAEPKIDVTENDKAYTVKAEIPGVKKDDINVKIDGNFVSISADVHEEKQTQGNGDRVLTRERYHGSMSRAFTLAHEVNDQEASAKFENGILTLTLPKRAETRGTKIPVS